MASGREIRGAIDLARKGHTGADLRRRRAGRIVLDKPTYRAWETEQEPGRRSVWTHGGHRFEVLERLPVPPELDGVVFLLAVPLDAGPNPGAAHGR